MCTRPIDQKAAASRAISVFARVVNVCLVLLALLGASTAGASPVRMTIFGDSLSDTGNMFGLSGGQIPPSPPYAHRFSNGPVWGDQVAASQGLASPNNAFLTGTLTGGIDNFAVGGAYTGTFPFPGPASSNSNDQFAGAPVFPGLQEQVGLFSALGGGVAPDDTWYTMWAGANDLIFADLFGLTASQVAVPAVGNIRLAVESLAGMGADEFLLLNLPDIGSTPFGVLSGRAAELSAGSALFNAELAGMAADLSSTAGLDITLLDIHALFEDLMADPEGAGFSDASVLSFLPPGFSFCIDQNTLTDFCSASGFDPNERVFWDLVHPSEHAHSFIADAVLAVKVPEPASLPLLVVALAALAWARGRRVAQYPGTQL